MKKIKYLRYFATVVVCCVLLCGCSVRDAAIVIPMEDSNGENGEENELLGSEDEPEKQDSLMEEELSLIYVYVCGAVVNPGVVEIPEGSRVEDALLAAGGFTEDAQTDYVNLAAKVTDGEMIYFPTREEAEELKRAKEEEQKGLVNINTADISQLMTLPGIGESRAQDIISYREEYGEFQEKEDLMKISGIKENMYAKLCDKIVVR